MKGGEFKNKMFHKFCSQNGIKLFHAETFKAGFIERYYCKFRYFCYSYDCQFCLGLIAPFKKSYINM